MERERPVLGRAWLRSKPERQASSGPEMAQAITPARATGPSLFDPDFNRKTEAERVRPLGVVQRREEELRLQIEEADCLVTNAEPERDLGMVRWRMNDQTGAVIEPQARSHDIAIAQFNAQ